MARPFPDPTGRCPTGPGSRLLLGALGSLLGARCRANRVLADPCAESDVALYLCPRDFCVTGGQPEVGGALASSAVREVTARGSVLLQSAQTCPRRQLTPVGSQLDSVARLGRHSGIDTCRLATDGLGPWAPSRSKSDEMDPRARLARQTFSLPRSPRRLGARPIPPLNNAVLASHRLALGMPDRAPPKLMSPSVLPKAWGKRVCPLARRFAARPLGQSHHSHQCRELPTAGLPTTAGDSNGPVSGNPAVR